MSCQMQLDTPFFGLATPPAKHYYCALVQKGIMAVGLLFALLSLAGICYGKNATLVLVKDTVNQVSILHV